MKNRSIPLLCCLAALFIGLTTGFFLGRNVHRQAIVVYAPPATQPEPTSAQPETTATQPEHTAAQPEHTAVQPQPTAAAQPTPVNINTATAEQLQALPGIGPVLAQRIVDYRLENGPFPDKGSLIQVSGIGEAKLEGLWDYITTGG